MKTDIRSAVSSLAALQTVGFICPMPCELDAVTRLFEERRTVTFGGMEFTEGKICGKRAVAALCGVGKVFAAVCTKTMLLGFSPELIINTGVAGNLSDRLSIGDVVVSTAVVQHDMDTSPLGDPVGLLSGIGEVYLKSDEEAAAVMTACLHELGIGHAAGVVASGDQFIATEERKEWIKTTFGALCCEMEGAAVGQVCHLSGTRFLVLRALSDGADGASPEDFPAYCVKVSEQSSRAVAAFMRAIATP